jgi:hypothetical protein
MTTDTTRAAWGVTSPLATMPLMLLGHSQWAQLTEPNLSRMMATLRRQIDIPCPTSLARELAVMLAARPGAGSPTALETAFRQFPRIVAEDIAAQCNCHDQGPTAATIFGIGKDRLYQIDQALRRASLLIQQSVNRSSSPKYLQHRQSVIAAAVPTRLGENTITTVTSTRPHTREAGQATKSGQTARY